jgi:hypothetical protein
LGPNSAELDGVSTDQDKDVEDLLEELRHAGMHAASLHERLFHGLLLKYVQAYSIGTYDLWVISPTLENVKKRRQSLRLAASFCSGGQIRTVDLRVMSSKPITPTSEHRARSLRVTWYTAILKHSVCDVGISIPELIFCRNIQFPATPTVIRIHE